ncbi:MAG: CBS domain-containing protein [Pirellulaceae bacterium]
MSVGRLCVREVDVAHRDESVWHGAERMHQRSVGTLVVVDSDRRPVGIVTDRDLVERVIAKNLDYHLTTLDAVMTPDPATIHEAAPIEAAVKMMRGGRFRRIPVVNDEGELVGLLSLDDVLMLLAEEFHDIGVLLNRETPRGMAQEACTSAP